MYRIDESIRESLRENLLYDLDSGTYGLDRPKRRFPHFSDAKRLSLLRLNNTVNRNLFLLDEKHDLYRIHALLPFCSELLEELSKK